MQLIDTELPEVKRLKLAVHGDARGFFVERFRQEWLGVHFVQDNHSRSAAGVVRGLHFQFAPKQGKLVGVTRGKILDVAVDVRPSSPNFGKHVAVELSDLNGELLWIPEGFAHGFAALEESDVYYKLTAPYAPEGEFGIRQDDADIGIQWPVANKIISDRDSKLPGLMESKAKLAEWFA